MIRFVRTKVEILLKLFVDRGCRGCVGSLSNFKVWGSVPLTDVTPLLKARIHPNCVCFLGLYLFVLMRVSVKCVRSVTQGAETSSSVILHVNNTLQRVLQRHSYEASPPVSMRRHITLSWVPHTVRRRRKPRLNIPAQGCLFVSVVTATAHTVIHLATAPLPPRLKCKTVWVPPVSSFQHYTFSPQCINVLYLTRNREFCPIQHSVTGFYNRDGKCLLRSTNWVFK
jgi:hypothetical protein